jgi:GT2 family glycosyltransferase
VAADPGFVPRRILTIELGGQIAPIEPAPGPRGTPWRRAAVLVRIHTWPIGFIDLGLVDGALSAEAVCANLEAALGPTIATHLLADGLEVPEPLSPAGVPLPDDVACLAGRRAFLTAAPPVTVVVPVADRPALLERCLADLAAQDYPAFDVIVVDNAPGRSGARAVVEAIGNRDPARSVRCVDQARPGSSLARNTGLDASTTEITAFVDADVRVDAHWLTELVQPMASNTSIACTTGLILPAELRTAAQAWLMEWGGYAKGFEPRLFDLDRHRGSGPLYPYQPGLYGSGQSMAFRTAVLRGLGGFDLALGVRTASEGGEELAAFLDVVLAGHGLAYAPGAIVWHPDQADEAAFIAKLESYAVGLSALMTRTVVRHPGATVAILRRAPGAVRYFFGGSSRRNRERSSTFPQGAVRAAEVRGIAKGPFAYASSRLGLRRTSPTAGAPER